MKIIKIPADMQRQASAWKRDGLKIALVPTMGCLHNGHLSLMRKAAEYADRVIVSLFINPIQFGPNEDFDAYPRQFQTDCDLAQKEGVQVIFCPDVTAMYPEGFQTTVSVKTLAQGMCGAKRPGHFDGVATVVCKLLHLALPDFAIFGEKDFQQLAIIRQVVWDLDFPVKIIGAPIVREVDGLAMSSRNKYLQGEMRNQALCLYKALQGAREIVAQTQHKVPAETIIAATEKTVAAAGGELEYAVVINEHSLKPETLVGGSSVLAIAVKIGGRVRLIDNGKLITTKA
ncbi:MAG: pantoate--beta-alanine ligase [Pseudomonadota bacterium]